MNRDEADITPKINKWFQKVVDASCPIEIKHTRSEAVFTMSELKVHQRDWLLASTTEHGSIWKIPDTGYGFNPFDCLHYKNSNAYVIIAFPEWVVAIEIRLILTIKTPSMNIEEALSLAWFKVKLKDL